MPALPSAASPAGDLTHPQRVQAVIAHPDPVVRNLQITQSYHELTRALDLFFGGVDLCWCAFATWASKQAGRFIRHQEVPPPLRRFLGLDDGRDRPAPWTPRGLFLTRRFLTYARLTAEDVGRHVADGNHLVYRLLAPLYADLLVLLRRTGGRPDAAEREAFAARLAAAASAGEEVERAFGHYLAALAEGDAGRRAERVFSANALVGLHEQRRLQQAVEGSLSAPIRRALADPRRRWSEWRMPELLRKLGALAFHTLFALPIRRFEEEFQQVATRCVMTLGLPGGRLELGEDLPPLPDGAVYPPALARLTLPEAVAVVAELDATPDTTRGSAARNWARLGDRMNYVVDFFRSRQQLRALLDPPFSPQQVRAIHAGEVPPGAL